VGLRNFLVEGVSGTGKTAVCDELQRRGFHAVHGDRELAYRGDPVTGDPTVDGGHEHHLWDVEAVRALIADRTRPVTYLCGGSRNFHQFVAELDAVFVLEVDADTLVRRLDHRPQDEWGHRPEERQLVLRLRATREDVPRDGIVIDATAPLSDVVDEILRLSAGPAGE
jgi:gluconate kinase